MAQMAPLSLAEPTLRPVLMRSWVVESCMPVALRFWRAIIAPTLVFTESIRLSFHSGRGVAAFAGGRSRPLKPRQAPGHGQAAAAAHNTLKPNRKVSCTACRAPVQSTVWQQLPGKSVAVGPRVSARWSFEAIG